MYAKQADLYGWAETNVSWTELSKNQMEYHGRRIHDNYKLIATSNDNLAGYKQPGGTCLALVDKTVGRHMYSNNNDKGPGHWCYACITGRDQHKVYFVVGCRPCKQNKPGDTTVNAQQKRLLTMQGDHDPKPHK
eukprot:14346796-Ditylum_brightwellii.AAC.1